MDGYGYEGGGPLSWVRGLVAIGTILYPLVLIGSGILAYRLCKTRDGGERFLFAMWVTLGFFCLPLLLILAPLLVMVCPLVVPGFIWLLTKPRGSL